MARVLVTGASGRLGRVVVPRLTEAMHEVRAMSRTKRADADGVTWVIADVDQRDQALDDALQEIEVVVHLASNRATADATDVEGTSNLLAAAEAAGVKHLLYVSIVGIDELPLPYYQAKLAAEQAIAGSSVPSTIFRTTQLHELLSEWLVTAAGIGGGPAMIAGGTRFRPVASSEVADRVVALIKGGAAGRVRDLAGPETLNAPELATRHARKTKQRVTLYPAEAGTVAAAFLGAAHLGNRCDLGTVRFGD